MKLNFKQGIVSCRLIGNQPDFLEFNQTYNTVDIDITTEPLYLNFSHQQSNYLFVHRTSVTSAWGPFIWNNRWGTQPVVTTYYLYWDINLATGIVSRKYIPHNQIVANVAPPNPKFEQLWYDLSQNIMKQWNGGFWVNKCILLAGNFNLGNHTFNHLPTGSQVGVSYPRTLPLSVNSGYLVYGMDQKGIKNADGSFLTTSEQILINAGGGVYSSPVKMESLDTYAIAAEPIPAFRCITNFKIDEIKLASNQDITKYPVGVTESAHTIGQSIRYFTEGALFNDQWNWDFSRGKDLFIGAYGEILQEIDLLAHDVRIKIGTILGKNVILLTMGQQPVLNPVEMLKQVPNFGNDRILYSDLTGLTQWTNTKSLLANDGITILSKGV